MSKSPERRKTPRVRGHIRVAYGQTEVCVSDLTEDLSEKGLFVRTPYPLEIGAVLQIEIQWTSGAKEKSKEKLHTLRLKGRVMRVHNAFEGAGMGIEFEGLSDEERQTLRDMVSKLKVPGKTGS